MWRVLLVLVELLLLHVSVAYRRAVCSAKATAAGSFGGGEEGPHDKWTRGGQPAAGKHVFRGVRTTLSEVDAKGRLVRSPSRYRSWISAGSRFQPQANRYHLYVSLGCPWSCRVLSVLYMKRLDNAIGISVVHPVWQRTRPNDELDSHVGWVFRSPKDPAVRSLVAGSMRVAPQHDCDGCIPDYVNSARSIREIYELARDKDGKYTVPLLWDKRLGTIVNNESGDLMRILNSEFNHLAATPQLNLLPQALASRVNRVNDWIYETINDGVYRCAFAKSQLAYDEAITLLFQGLDRAEALLSGQRYLAGTRFTEADLRLFHTLVRFDEVYSAFSHANRKLIATNYPHLLNYCREIYQLPGVSESVNIKHCKAHCFGSYPGLHPTGIVPATNSFVGLQLFQPHDRHKLPGWVVF